MSARRLVGVDIGGTSVKLGAVDLEGNVLGEANVPIEADLRERRAGPGSLPANALLDAIVERARELAPDEELERLGVGIPGLFDRATGTIAFSPNLPWFAGVSVTSELATRLGVEVDAVTLENDANVAALGEAWLGGGKGSQHVLVVTLGTGVGGGLILNGELFIGEGGAGEIGHVIVDPTRPASQSGLTGSVENLASATAAMRRAREAGLVDDLAELARRARKGAGPERELFETIGYDLGLGLAAPLMLLDVQTFVFGGGFAGALDVLEPGIRRGMKERDFGTRDDAVRILPATLGSRAGWLGAAKLSDRR